MFYPKPVSIPMGGKLATPRTGAIKAEGPPLQDRPNSKSESILSGMAGELHPSGEPKWVPGSPEFMREYGRRYAGTSVVPESGGVRSNYDILTGNAPPTPGLPATQPAPKQPGLQ